MAEKETIIPIKVDGTDAITTLKDLKNAIKSNRDALVALGNVEDDDTEKKEKQSSIIKELQKNTKLLNDVMRAGKAQSADSAKAVDIATGSYDELNAELRELRKTFHAMSAAERDSQFGQETITRINELDVKLKELDGSVGQYQRNVGNYGKTYSESLDSARESTDQLRTGLEAFNSMSILADKDASTLTKTIAGFQIASNLLEGSKGLGGLVEKGKAWLAGMKEQNVTTKLLTGSMVGEATATGTATVATNVFKKALISTGIGAVVVAIGTLIAHLDDLAEMFGFAGSAAEDFEEKNESARVSLDLFNEDMERELRYMEASGASQETLLKKRVEMTKKAFEDAEDNTEAEQDAWDAYMKAWDDLIIWQREQETKSKENQKKAEEDKKKRREEAWKKAYEDRKKQANDIAEELRKGEMTELEILTEKYEKELALLNEFGKDTTALTRKYEEERAEIIKKETEKAETQRRRTEMDEWAKHKTEITPIVAQAQTEMEEGGLAKTEEVEKKKFQIRKRSAEEWVDLSVTSMDSVGALLGGIAELYEAKGEEDKEAQRKAKNLRIAEATISMITGATQAFATAFQLGPIAGPIVGAINSAAVIAAGVANINKIKSTNVDGESSGGGVGVSTGAVNPPSVESLPPISRQLTGAKEEERLNRMAEPQQVYILSSQLEADRNARKVEVQETTF